MVVKILGFLLVTAAWGYIILAFTDSVVSLSNLEVVLGAVVMTFITEKAAALHDKKYAKKIF